MRAVSVRREGGVVGDAVGVGVRVGGAVGFGEGEGEEGKLGEGVGGRIGEVSFFIEGEDGDVKLGVFWEVGGEVIIGGSPVKDIAVFGSRWGRGGVGYEHDFGERRVVGERPGEGRLFDPRGRLGGRGRERRRERCGG